MKKLIQLTLATVFVVITVLTVNINQADAAGPPLVCNLQPMQGCSGFKTPGERIYFIVKDGAPFQAGATVEVQGACDLTIYVPPRGSSIDEMCPTGGPYFIINDGPDSVRVTAYSE